MSVVHWVPELEGEHRVRPHLLEAFAQLGRGQSGCICGKRGKILFCLLRFWEDTIVLFVGEMFAKNVGRGHHGKTVFAKKSHGIVGTVFLVFINISGSEVEKKRLECGNTHCGFLTCTGPGRPPT